MKLKSCEFSDPPGPMWALLRCLFMRCVFVVWIYVRTNTMCETNDHLSAGSWWVNHSLGRKLARIRSVTTQLVLLARKPKTAQKLLKNNYKGLLKIMLKGKFAVLNLQPPVLN